DGDGGAAGGDVDPRLGARLTGGPAEIGEEAEGAAELFGAAVAQRHEDEAGGGGVIEPAAQAQDLAGRADADVVGGAASAGGAAHQSRSLWGLERAVSTQEPLLHCEW